MMMMMMMMMMISRPPGVFEWDNFSKGTQGVLDAVVNATKKGAVTIVGTCLCMHRLYIFTLICFPFLVIFLQARFTLPELTAQVNGPS